MKKARKLTAVVLAIMLCLSMFTIGTMSASAFSVDNFKAQIKEIHIGAPITRVEGGKYLPVDIHFTASEDLSNEEMAYFIEGYLRVKLKNGTLAEGINGLGMTLMGPVKPDVTLDNNMWSWNWTPYETGDGQGVIKFNLPLLDEGDTQTVEKSLATGQEEVNGVKVGDEVTFQISTVVNTSQFPENVVKEVFPNGPEVYSDEAPVTIEELLSYPRKYNITAYDTTEPDTEEETVESTEASTEEAETTAATEPTTEAVETSAPETTAATEPVTENIETTTAPETTAAEVTEPVTEAASTSAEAVVDDPTQATTEAQLVTEEATTSDKTTLPATEATQQEVVVDPTQPATQEVTQEATQAETAPVTQPATEAEVISIKDAKVTAGKVGSYDGKEKTPEITVVIGGKKLEKDKDFTVEYKNNKNAGKGTAVVTGKGAYKDSTEVKFEIGKAKNPLKIKTVSAKVKAKKLKSKKRTVKVLKLSDAEGKVTVKISKAGKLKGKIRINKDGKITLKKGKYKKGTYKFKVKITAKGNNNYAQFIKTKKISIKIR